MTDRPKRPRDRKLAKLMIDIAIGEACAMRTFCDGDHFVLMAACYDKHSDGDRGIRWPTSFEHLARASSFSWRNWAKAQENSGITAGTKWKSPASEALRVEFR
jgi:hypothetical protein